MKKCIILAVAIASIVLIVGLPMGIDWLIIGNKMPSNISNTEWVGFLGDYIGALIGAIISLIGITITIRYTNKQNKIGRELQVRPYCSIRYTHDSKLVGTNKILAELPIICEPQENNNTHCTYILYLKNVGLGSAIEFNCTVDAIDDGREHCLSLMAHSSNPAVQYVTLLQPGEEAAFPIHIHFNFDLIREEDFIVTNDDNLKYIVKSEIHQKYKNFDMCIHIKYCDLYQNVYCQKVTLGSNMYIKYSSTEKQAEHMCDIYLKEVSKPTKVK